MPEKMSKIKRLFVISFSVWVALNEGEYISAPKFSGNLYL